MKKNSASLHNKIYRKTRLIVYKKIGLEKSCLSFYETYRKGKKWLKKHGISEYDVNLGKEGQYYPDHTSIGSNIYFAQIPNEGAGIGHQIANYNSGLRLALRYGVSHAYSIFKSEAWDRFLGFGRFEPTIHALVQGGYKVKKLPSIGVMGGKYLDAIVNYYKESGEKVILLTQIDEGYAEQFGVIPYIKRKFDRAEARQDDEKVLGQYANTILHKDKGDYINIAVHIRRGDITPGQQSGDTQLTQRWLNNDYYEKIVSQLADKYKDKKINIFVFSQGNKEDFKFLEPYGDVQYCIDAPAMQSFLCMVRADVLVTSKSSFSYKPALLSDGIRICPPGFWHGYPDDQKWIVAGEDGKIENALD